MGSAWIGLSLAPSGLGGGNIAKRKTEPAIERVFLRRNKKNISMLIDYKNKLSYIYSIPTPCWPRSVSRATL